MKILIIGAGQVGGTLAANLASEAFDITLIDSNEASLKAGAPRKWRQGATLGKRSTQRKP